jgi:molecular chaperone Hsp33
MAGEGMKLEKKKIYGDTLKEQLLASSRDKLNNFIMAQGMIRGVVVNGTRMVNEMRWNHELGILETLVLGHAYLAAALLSANLKGNDRISIGVDCTGPIKGLSVEANAFGEVRGYLKKVPIPISKPLESFNLSPFYGAGVLSVTKYLEDAKHPFEGMTVMEYGTLAKDLALYFFQSEQIPTTFSLGVFFDAEGEIAGAGGLFLQAMPGADDTILEELEAIVESLPSLGKIVHSEGFPGDWIHHTFARFDPKELGRRSVEFMCHCNTNQIRGMLGMLDKHELTEISKNGPFPVEIRCHNCGTRYAFNQTEIQRILMDRIERPDLIH